MWASSIVGLGLVFDQVNNSTYLVNTRGEIGEVTLILEAVNFTALNEEKRKKEPRNSHIVRKHPAIKLVGSYFIDGAHQHF